MSSSRKPGSARKVVSASIDPALHARLLEWSDDTGLSMSWLVGQAVRRYLDAADAQAGDA